MPGPCKLTRPMPSRRDAKSFPKSSSRLEASSGFEYKPFHGIFTTFGKIGKQPSSSHVKTLGGAEPPTVVFESADANFHGTTALCGKQHQKADFRMAITVGRGTVEAEHVEGRRKSI
jgi:hypothetical protein